MALFRTSGLFQNIQGTRLKTNFWKERIIFWIALFIPERALCDVLAIGKSTSDPVPVTSTPTHDTFIHGHTRMTSAKLGSSIIMPTWLLDIEAVLWISDVTLGHDSKTFKEYQGDLHSHTKNVMCQPPRLCMCVCVRASVGACISLYRLAL